MTFKQQFEIDGCLVGEGCPTYVIAEMSANHGNDLNKAIMIIGKTINKANIAKNTNCISNDVSSMPDSFIFSVYANIFR